MYSDTSFQDYARLAVTSGVNLEPGQNLVISTNPGTYEFARLLAQEAYKAGAGFVRILVEDQVLNALRAKHASPQTWDYFPPFLQGEFQTFVTNHWARIAIEDLEDLEASTPDLQKALGHFRRVRAQSLSFFRDAQIRDEIPWTVIAVPGPRWARRLGLKEEALWEVLKKILRLDTPDPALAWRQAGSLLESRAGKLTGMGLMSLRFTAPGTDLTIGLIPGAQWLGGGSLTTRGRPFIPNIPTEEVFTTPDWRKTEGRVAITRPVEVLGTLVRGAWFEYKAGKVAGFGAEEGLEALKNYLALDPQAGSLGEVALVDHGNPISSSGILFGSILLDENASCHIALGFGYPTAVPQSEKLTEEELNRKGCNISLVHTDFMIGSGDLTVTGIDGAGREIPLVKNGKVLVE